MGTSINGAHFDGAKLCNGRSKPDARLRAMFILNLTLNLEIRNINARLCHIFVASYKHFVST